MHEVAVATTVAAVLLKLPAGCLTEVCHRGVLHYDRAARVEAALKGIVSSDCLLFLPELDIDIPDHVVSKVVTHIQGLNLAELAQLLVDILIEVLKVLLHLLWSNSHTLGINSRGDHIRPLVHVSKHNSWRCGWPVVQTGATIPMTASSNLEVKGAVDPILLRAKN